MIITAVNAPAPSAWLTSWSFDAVGAVGVVLALALSITYAVGLVRAHRAGTAWPAWRTAAYLLLGIGSLLYATCGPIGSLRSAYLWMFALHVSVLGTVTPVALALGDPVRLMGWQRLFTGRLARLVTFPLLAVIVDAAGILAVFLTGYGQAALDSGAVGVILVLHMLIVGLVFSLPLLEEGVLPQWATPPVRTLIALGDGLVDAIPGIVVMTTTTLLMPRFPGFSSAGADPHLQQKWAGGALLATAESIGLPMIAILFAQWMRHDERQAAQVDLVLDAIRPVSDDPDEPETDRPWWLDDPRFAHRFKQD